MRILAAAFRGREECKWPRESNQRNGANHNVPGATEQPGCTRPLKNSGMEEVTKGPQDAA